MASTTDRPPAADAQDVPDQGAPAPAVQAAGLTKRYGSKEVLKAVDVAVPVGSVLGLLGKNGAGKTTLIKCALGLVRPDAGTVTVLGEPAWSLSAAAKARIGHVPQEVSLYPWMRAAHLIQYVAAFYPRWNKALVRQLLAAWDVDVAQRVGKLSPGTRQRL